MEATFVHGSPYVYFKAYVGDLELRTLRQDGVNEKGTFSTGSNMYGIWTSVAGKTNNFLIVGEGATTFTDVSASSDPMTMGSIRVNNTAKEMTLVYRAQTLVAPQVQWLTSLPVKRATQSRLWI